ncbi:hypothetical protein SUGI_0491150 [Cryptomeria japonica]|nr:hypothetical protein SUGI_0491150 [Cryptomeria japonica]
MSQRDAVLWYIQNGNLRESLKLFRRIQQLENVPVPEQLKQIHGVILKSGQDIDVYTGSRLIDLYAKSQLIEDARKEMQQANVPVDEFTVATVLGACSSLLALDQGLQAHAHIVKAGFGVDAYIATALIDMYAKCNCVEGFRKVIDERKDPSLVNWTALISGYTQNGLPGKAIEQQSVCDISITITSTASGMMSAAITILIASETTSVARCLAGGAVFWKPLEFLSVEE